MTIFFESMIWLFADSPACVSQAGMSPHIPERYVFVRPNPPAPFWKKGESWLVNLAICCIQICQLFKSWQISLASAAARALLGSLNGIDRPKTPNPWRSFTGEYDFGFESPLGLPIFNLSFMIALKERNMIAGGGAPGKNALNQSPERA